MRQVLLPYHFSSVTETLEESTMKLLEDNISGKSNVTDSKRRVGMYTRWRPETTEVATKVTHNGESCWDNYQGSR